jgi:hypothetical protein
MNTASPSAQYFVRFGSPAPDSGYGYFWREAAIRKNRRCLPSHAWEWTSFHRLISAGKSRWWGSGAPCHLSLDPDPGGEFFASFRSGEAKVNRTSAARFEFLSI